jgi:glycosyltransferase involved in cell wall biosynthesis
MGPRVTVILPVYNGMPHLPRAVESILNQTFVDFTLTIVNDGSTDGSADYLDTLKDPRVVRINQVNAGQGAARNAALFQSRSDYIAVMDQDDISQPARLSSQVEYLDAHPEVVLVGTQIEFLIGDKRQRALPTPLHHEEIEARLLNGRAGICHPSLMYRTAAAIACGGYPNGVFGEDIDFCLRMLEHGRGANLESVLFQYRLHAAQASLARCRELISANCYAAYRATCRRDGKEAAPLSTYIQGAPLTTRLRWFLEAWELIQYRTARIEIAGGKRFRGMVRLALIGFSRPLTSLKRAASALRSATSGPQKTS